jgi:hypothetical protein
LGLAKTPLITQMNLSNAVKDFKLQSETATQSVKDLRDSVAKADKTKLENLKEQLFGIRISAKESANELRRFREAAGLPGVVPEVIIGNGNEDDKGGAAPKAPALSGLPALIAESRKMRKFSEKKPPYKVKDLAEEVAKWITSSQTCCSSKPSSYSYC